LGVLALGTTSNHFAKPDVKVNSWEVLLMQKLLSDIRQLPEFDVYQQDSVPAHNTGDS